MEILLRRGYTRDRSKENTKDGYCSVKANRLHTHERTRSPKKDSATPEKAKKLGKKSAKQKGCKGKQKRIKRKTMKMDKERNV